MKWWRVVIAFAIAGALGLVAVRFSDAPKAAASTRAPLVARDAIDPERLASIELDRDGVHYSFERRGTSWWQTKPVLAAVDGWSMRQLATRLLKVESVRVVDAAAQPGGEAKSLSDAGLVPPTARIVLKEEASAGASPRELTIDLGRRTLAGRAYARVSGSGPTGSYHVIDSALHEFAVERDPKEYRRREVFVDLGEVVDRIALSSGSNELVVARQGRGPFRLESPVKSRADRAQCEELVDALRRAKSSGFVADNPVELSAYGLSPAMARLEVEAGGKKQTLLIGDAVSIGAQDRFGMIEGTSTVVRLPAAVLAPIIPRVERLIDAVASGVRARDIGGIEIAAGTKRISLRREVDRWTATRSEQGGTAEAVAGSVETKAVDGLLTALLETRAGSVDIAPFPADQSIATVTLLGFANEPIDTVRIARRASDSKLLLENGDGVLRVHGAIELPITAEELGFLPKH